MKLNKVTTELKPYPMEELSRIRRELQKKGVAVFDFGTGDPRIPTWEPIRTALKDAIPEISQYPGIRGQDELRAAHLDYLHRRFGIHSDKVDVMPSQGSKEAVFHAALCIVGRSGGKKHIIYPDPGYPVYRTSTLFAGGIPYPVKLSPDNGYLLEPWTLPSFIQKDAAAIWVNYPHNPTGAMAPMSYWQRLIDWALDTDTLLLSDDCYVDIYDCSFDEKEPQSSADRRPSTPLMVSSENTVSFMSLSKRSGMTGYRSGLIAGDPEIIAGFARGRANFGVGSPDFIQKAAVVAWKDDEHVRERRRIFSRRLAIATPVLQELGMIDEAPEATFYLWARLPKGFGGNDVKFCLALAEKGVICSPSQWLGESVKGYVRFAMVPDEEELDEAFGILRDFVTSKP